jgi:hypothetical protein
MNRHSTAASVLLGFLCGIVCVGAFESLRGPAAPAIADEPKPAPIAGAAGVDNKSPSPKEMTHQQREEAISQLTIKYAKINLKLAQLNLQSAQAYNQNVAGSFSQAEVERLQRLAEMAQARLKWAETHGNQADANRLSAELAVQSAEVTYRKALATNNQRPGAISPTILEQRRLTLELARLNVRKAELVGHSASQLEDLQWQVDQLREDMLILRSQFEAITSRR